MHYPIRGVDAIVIRVHLRRGAICAIAALNREQMMRIALDEAQAFLLGCVRLGVGVLAGVPAARRAAAVRGTRGFGATAAKNVGEGELALGGVGRETQ